MKTVVRPGPCGHRQGAPRASPGGIATWSPESRYAPQRVTGGGLPVGVNRVCRSSPLIMGLEIRCVETGQTSPWRRTPGRRQRRRSWNRWRVNERPGSATPGRSTRRRKKSAALGRWPRRASNRPWPRAGHKACRASFRRPGQPAPSATIAGQRTPWPRDRAPPLTRPSGNGIMHYMNTCASGERNS